MSSGIFWLSRGNERVVIWLISIHVLVAMKPLKHVWHSVRRLWMSTLILGIKNQFFLGFNSSIETLISPLAASQVVYKAVLLLLFSRKYTPLFCDGLWCDGLQPEWLQSFWLEGRINQWNSTTRLWKMRVQHLFDETKDHLQKNTIQWWCLNDITHWLECML